MLESLGQNSSLLISLRKDGKMAQPKRKILEEGDYDLYIHEATLWSSKIREVTAYKVSLSRTPRGKPITWLMLFDGAARLWAVQLAEYCIKSDLPWPSFRLHKDVLDVLKVLKRKRVSLRICIVHRSMDGELIFSDPKLLRPSS